CHREMIAVPLVSPTTRRRPWAGGWWEEFCRGSSAWARLGSVTAVIGVWRNGGDRIRCGSRADGCHRLLRAAEGREVGLVCGGVRLQASYTAACTWKPRHQAMVGLSL